MVEILENLIDAEHAIRLASQIFEGNHKIIYDASSLHALDKYMCKQKHRAGSINIQMLELAIVFFRKFNELVRANLERILSFPDLYAEHYGRIRPSKDSAGYVINSIQRNKNPDLYFRLLDKQTRKYKAKLGILDGLLKRCSSKKLPFQHIADNLLETILYLNNKFRWNKPSNKFVDARIMALGIVSAAYGNPTKIYTLDSGIRRYMQNALSMLTSNDLYNSALISRPVKSFLKQVRESDLCVLGYDEFAKEFINESDVQGRIVRNINRYYFPAMSREEKKECILKISENLSKVFH